MVDGSALLMTFIHGLKAMGVWSGPRGTNLLDSGAPFYDVYECADGEYVALGSIEPQFYAELVRLSGMAHEPHQMDRGAWPEMRDELTRVMKSKTRDEWCALMEASDVCFAPVLSMEEAPSHPHNVARDTFVDVAGVPQPNAAPRFSRTPGAIQGPPAHAGQHTDEILAEAGTERRARSPPCGMRERWPSGLTGRPPRPPRRRVDPDRRHHGQGGSGGSPGDVGRGYPGRARRGRARCPRRGRAPRPPPHRRDLSVRRAARCPAGRVPGLCRLRDDGRAHQRRAGRASGRPTSITPPGAWP